MFSSFNHVIVLYKDLKEDLISVSKRSDKSNEHQARSRRDGGKYHMRLCSPSRLYKEKEMFWEQMDQELSATPDGERVIVGGDLNGHIGRRLREYTEDGV